MFLHDLYYEIKSSLRAKDLIIWLMIFPIVLGTFFKVAFSSIYEKETNMAPIPAAIVVTEENDIFRMVMDSVSEGSDALFKAEYTDEEDALEKLKNGDVDGIIFVGDDISMQVAADGIEQSVMKTFIMQYKTREKIINDTLTSDPANVPAVVEALSREIASAEEIPLTDGNTDVFAQYFYNLIAMVAMYGSITGLHIGIGNQANLSPLGARKNCSPTPKSVSLTAGLAGSIIVQSVCMILCVSFTAFVLKVGFGSRLPLVYLAAILGGVMGVSLGFFVGSIGNMKTEMKIGISMAVSMIFCFLSGLMIADMKSIMAQYVPWFNNINPAAVVTDSISALNLYSDLSRFTQKIITMIIISVIFDVSGFIITRRKKYASL